MKWFYVEDVKIGLIDRYTSAALLGSTIAEVKLHNDDGEVIFYTLGEYDGVLNICESESSKLGEDVMFCGDVENIKQEKDYYFYDDFYDVTNYSETLNNSVSFKRCLLNVVESTLYSSETNISSRIEKFVNEIEEKFLKSEEERYPNYKLVNCY